MNFKELHKNLLLQEGGYPHLPAQAQQPKDNLSLGEPIIKMHEDEPDIIFGSDIQKLGAKLADLLDEDQFADCEQLLLSIASAQSKQDSKIQSIGVVQHYAAPSGAAPYVTVRWEKQPPNHGAKVYASLPTKEAECAHMRKIIFQVFNDDAFLSLAAGVRENVSIVVNNLPLAPKEGT